MDLMEDKVVVQALRQWRLPILEANIVRSYAYTEYTVVMYAFRKRRNKRYILTKRSEAHTCYVSNTLPHLTGHNTTNDDGMEELVKALMARHLDTTNGDTDEVLPAQPDILFFPTFTYVHEFIIAKTTHSYCRFPRIPVRRRHIRILFHMSREDANNDYVMSTILANMTVLAGKLTHLYRSIFSRLSMHARVRKRFFGSSKLLSNSLHLSIM